MSEAGGYSTLLELCTHMNAAAPAPSRHASHSDAPSTECLSSSPLAEASTIMAGASAVNSKPSGSVAAAAASVASLPHFHFPPAKRAPQFTSLVFDSEVEQGRGDEKFDLHAKKGVTVSSAPFNPMSRRATLPFTAAATCHGVGGATTSEGALRLALPTLGCSSKAICGQNPTRSVNHTRVGLAPAMVADDAHQQWRLDRLAFPGRAVAGEDAAEDAAVAEQGRPSLIDNLMSPVGAVCGDGEDGQSIDVASTPDSFISEADTFLGAVEMSDEEDYLSNLGATRRPRASSSADSVATAAADVCALGNGIDSSPPSCECAYMRGCPDPNCVSHMLGITVSPKAAQTGVPPKASAPAASAQFTHQRLSLSTPGRGTSATTILITAAATPSAAHAGDDVHPPESFPDAGQGAAPFPHSDREDTRMGGEGVLDVSGDPTAAACMQAKLPSTAHDALTVQHDASGSDEQSAPCPGVSAVGVGMCTEHDARLSFTIPINLLQPNTLLLTDTISEVCTSSFATVTTSKSTQESSSSTQLLGSREGSSIAASVSAPRSLQQHNSFDRSITGPKLGSPLQLTEELQGQKQEPRHPSSSPRDAFGIDKHSASQVSGGAPAAAVTGPLSSPSPFYRLSPGSPSSPPFALAQRRGTVAAFAEMELLPKEVVVKRREIPGKQKTTTINAVRPPRLLCRGPDRAAEDCRDLSDAVPTAPAMDSSSDARAHAESPGDDADLVDSVGAFFSAFQSKLGKWMTWVGRKYHGVVRRTSDAAGEEQSLPPPPPQQPLESPPRRSCAPQRESNDGSSGHRVSFSPGDSAEAVDSGSASFYDARSLKRKSSHLSFAPSLSTSQVNSSYDGERSRHPVVEEALCGLATPWNGGGNSTWYSVGWQVEPRGTGRVTNGFMQLRRSITASPQSPSTRDSPFPTPSGERLCGSTTPPNLSLSAESLTSTFDALTTQIFSGGALQRLSRSLGDALNSSASGTSMSGDHYSLSFPSSNDRHSRMSDFNTSAIADDRYRDTLYRLFRHPPSSLIGDLTECYEAYKAMSTSSNGHHVLNWGELGLLLQPEDYIDYRALFPPYHFVTFDDFVEFVEVLSLRYHR
ncbi:hypothetical protein LMJF_36_3940 [Leishmania major strain Friedlin]|uniref:Uncharacterized protein n=1 Tax=Leishmania major TaxID=5664 RepID=Q4Q121_LEIMA|nr:hypothetical protein LMJF_36_3940 [Leishmania major strain Friedlin]CAG9583938.1 hypothetical_protein_-_conserved [Leishmania major strain Friedlin]CAJ09360.1 hypothetical protein LMJF_36_3940 [Leishmania major strain Friedlin]|eukprot:XP_001686977.1 hypothetical protein LMJF_36_3940 [Leishmania major strain Friedlin]